MEQSPNQQNAYKTMLKGSIPYPWFTIPFVVLFIVFGNYGNFVHLIIFFSIIAVVYALKNKKTTTTQEQQSQKSSST